MESSATFYFYNSLNDFLPQAKKNKPINYLFKGQPSIKDAIEAVGIPHTEVDEIVINDSEADFFYKLKNNDSAHLYPLSNITKRSSKSLIPRIIEYPKFIVDANAGKLTKALRMLGIYAVDALHLKGEQLAEKFAETDYILLTRNRSLLKHKTVKHGYWLRSQNAGEQLKEIIQRFDLEKNMKPFTRCINCNAVIESVKTDGVIDFLPPLTRKYFNEFYQCSGCGKVYWKGSHYKNMSEKINYL